MPKLKTNKSASKRFKRTASGGFKHRSSGKNHILTKKPKKRKAHLKGLSVVKSCDVESVARMLNDK